MRHVLYILTIPLIILAVLGIGLPSLVGGLLLSVRQTLITMYETWCLLVECAQAQRDGEIE
jgi:hypothetical protein